MKRELKEKKRIKLNNKKLLKKYPWLTPLDWFGNRLKPKQHKYMFTELDNIPLGWVRAFGQMMCKELDETLRKHKIRNEFSLLQVKEKYGSLTIYYYPCMDEIDQVIDKYSYLSENICVECGCPDVPMTSDGWMIPLCKKCFDNDERWNEFYINNNGRMADTYTIKKFSKDGNIVTTYNISETAQKIRSRYAKTHRQPIT